MWLLSNAGCVSKSHAAHRSFLQLAAAATSGLPHTTASLTSEAIRTYAWGPAAAHGTTVLCIRKDGECVMLADGQLTLGDKVLKHNGRKIRRLALGALGGFAGSTADGLTLFERLETKLEQHPGQLRRAAVELAKAWRQDRVLRHLQATMIVADGTSCLEVSGSGEVLEPSDGVHAIGSGARFAIAAARALMDQPQLTALDIAHRAMRIAADKCIYTNDLFLWEGIGKDGKPTSGSSKGTPGSSTSSSSSSSSSISPDEQSSSGGSRRGRDNGGDESDSGEDEREGGDRDREDGDRQPTQPVAAAAVGGSR